MPSDWTWLLAWLDFAGFLAACEILTALIVQLSMIFCDMAEVEVFLSKLCLCNGMASIALAVIASDILEGAAVDAAWGPVRPNIPKTEKAYKWWKRVANGVWFFILTINVTTMVRLAFIMGECSIWFFLVVAYHEASLGYALGCTWSNWACIDDAIEFSITRTPRTAFV